MKKFLSSSLIATKISVVCFIFFFRKKYKKDYENEDELVNQNRLLCRFVVDGVGEKIGESVAVEDDLLIIKTQSDYLGVPLKHVEEQGKTIMVKGLVDRSKAEEMGEKWRKKSFSEINHEVEDEK